VLQLKTERKMWFTEVFHSFSGCKLSPHANRKEELTMKPYLLFQVFYWIIKAEAMTAKFGSY